LASLTIFLTSLSASFVRSSDGHLLLFAVPRSFADTLRIPDASISKVTSTWGTPRGAGGSPDEVELAEAHVVGRHGSFTLQQHG